MSEVVIIDGANLTIESIYKVAHSKNKKVEVK